MANSGVVGALKVLLGLDTAEFDTGIKKAKGSAKDFESNLTTLGKSFAGAFLPVVGVAGAGLALASFARQAFDTAGKITDLADQTGLSTQSIQEMQAAANLTSTSLEGFTNAAFKLGVNLAGGTDKVREAVSALGLSYQSLRDQSPDEQFKTIAAALGQVEDKQLRNKLAVDLFGRGAKEILPAIAQGYDEIAKSANAAADEQIRALDEAADAWSSFWNGAKNVATGVLGQLVINFRDTWRFMTIEPKRVLDEMAATLEAFGLKSAVLPKVFGEAAVKASLLPAPLKDITMSLAEQDRVTKQLTTSAEKQIATTVKGFDDEAAAAERFKESVLYFNTADFTDGIVRMVEPLRVSADEFAILASNVDIATNAFEPFKAAVVEVRTHVGRLGDAIKEGLTDVIGNIAQTMANAFTGGGNFLGAIKSVVSQIGSSIGESIGGLFGSGKLGKQIGSAIGSLAGLLVPAFKKLFGIGKDEAAEFRKELVKQYGSFQELERVAQSVGMTFVDLWKVKGKKGAEQLKAALKQLGDALEEQRRKSEEARKALEDELQTEEHRLDELISRAKDLGYNFDQQGNLISVSFQKMAELADKFGLSQEALGTSFQNARLAAGWKEVVDVITLFAKGGTDAGTILTGLKDEIGHLVSDSIKFKTTIPENMRPWIQNLIDTGQLIDDDGEKITDMAAINFGPPIESEFDIVQRAILDVIRVINDLIAKIGDFVNAIMGIPDRTVKVNTEYTYSGNPPDLSITDPNENVGFATGGLIPRTMRATVHKGELIGPVDFMTEALAGAMSSIGAFMLPNTGSLDAGALAGAGAGGGQTTQIINNFSFEVSTLDTDEMSRMIRRRVMPEINSQLSNVGELRTANRDALGI